MAITDLAGNPLDLLGNTGQLLGYTEPPPPEEVLSLDMYKFLIMPIRHQDKINGNLFVKRLLHGGQQIWQYTHQKAHDIKKLWSVTECPDAFLIYLKNIVGWTKELESITGGLDTTVLRRLISVSAPLWKNRGPEDAIADLFRVLTAQRTRIWNWFDFRWILEETGFGQEQQGYDPWLVDLPGPPNYDENRMNLRIVDDGETAHQLIRDVVNLMRATGERIEISYINFLDLFEADEDTSQWETLSGTIGYTINVADGLMTLNNTGVGGDKVLTNIENNEDWLNYVVAARFKLHREGTSDVRGGIIFYYHDSDNYYWAELRIGENKVYLNKRVSGVESVVASFDMISFPETLYEDVYYMMRVQMIQEGTGNRLKVWLDNNLTVDTTDGDVFRGNLGLIHNEECSMTVDEVEMFETPLETDTVDINYQG